MVRACGGCVGLGSHWRWCPRKVGPKASMLGIWAQRAEDLGDAIGSNDVGAANRCYGAAGDLLAHARRAEMEWRVAEGKWLEDPR